MCGEPMPQQQKQPHLAKQPSLSGISAQKVKIASYTTGRNSYGHPSNLQLLGNLRKPMLHPKVCPSFPLTMQLGH